jgi:hypothetical protein
LEQPSSPIPSAVVTVSTIEDLRSRPLFKAPVDPKQHKLIEVLTQYSFAKLAPCGLSTCKQWHLHGFLVRTSGGAETNIGHVCGKREFGEDFVLASAKYRRDEERRVVLNRVNELQSEASRIIQQVHGLTSQSFGVRWLFSVRDAVRARVGGPAFEHLKLRSVRQEYTVTRVKELSEAEIRVAMDRTGRKREQVRYLNESLGQLAPMEWTRWDFPGQLLAGVRDEFRLLATLVTSQMDTKVLKKNLKRLEGWELRIREAETILTQAVRFLEQGNLRIVDLAIAEFHKAARSPHPSPSLSAWASSQEYASLLQGGFREGQALG